MKKYMPLEGLRWSRDSGSTLCDTPQNGRSRTGWGGAVNILNDIDSDTPIYYIYSDRSSWDVEQHEYTKGVQNVKCIEFNSSKHGIPFLKVALPKFINLEVGQLDELTRKVQHPLLFTIKFVGIYKTISGLVSQAYKAFKKRH